MRKILNIAIGVLACMSMWAVPARRDGRRMVGADGVTKTVYMHGNEDFHYLTDETGVWLDEKTLLPLPEEMKGERVKGKGERAVRRAVKATGVDRLLAPRGPVILVSYQDSTFVHTREALVDWAMGENYSYNGATGSINRYFNDVSGGQYNLQLDIYGPVQVSKAATYYGSNSQSGYDLHPDALVVEACQLAAAQGADFSQYDSDNDGKVDFVVIIYAGLGEADSYLEETIWPHQDDLNHYGNTITLNGKTIDHYCCLNEIDAVTGELCGIGTFCHEFSHIMGLPDIYSTAQGANFKTLGEWDIMDYGCYNNGGNTPPAYSAYERWWMGWMKPTLLNQAASVTLGPLYTSREAAYLTGSGEPVTNILRPNPTLFYILENRQQTGWDTYIPGHGLLVTKINYHYNWWNGNTVNYSSTNMGIDIQEADGLTPLYNKNNRANGYFGKQGDAYPADTVTSFTTVSAYPVTHIAENNGVITFDVMGGGEAITLDIEPVRSAEKPVKAIREGRVVIIRDGKTYDLTGRQL